MAGIYTVQSITPSKPKRNKHITDKIKDHNFCSAPCVKRKKTYRSGENDNDWLERLGIKFDGEDQERIKNKVIVLCIIGESVRERLMETKWNETEGGRRERKQEKREVCGLHNSSGNFLNSAFYFWTLPLDFLRYKSSEPLFCFQRYNFATYDILDYILISNYTNRKKKPKIV